MTRHFAALTLLAACGCAAPDDIWKGHPGPRVLTTFAPYYCLAATVAGEDAAVQVLMSDKGPHDHDYSPKDAVKMAGATMLISNGMTLDDGFVKKMLRGSGNAKAKLLVLGDSLPDNLHIKMADAPGHEGHGHGDQDPHIWLGVPQTVALVAKLRDEFKLLDPAHAAGYDSRAAALTERLQKILADGKAKFKGKTERKLISFHESLGYFAHQFDLEIAGSIEPKAGVEPGSPWLVKLIEQCKKDKVRVIATEPQYSAKNAANVVLNELKKAGLDAVFVEIDPIETAPAGGLTPDYYETKLRENIDKLAAVLK